MPLLFTGFFLVTWILHGYPVTLSALIALVAALVLNFAPLPDLRPRRDRYYRPTRKELEPG